MVNGPFIDVNVSLGQWPTRRVDGDVPRRLAEKLHAAGVIEAWVGSFSGLFHDDLTAVNDRLARECAEERAVRFVPFASINPLTPTWEPELRRCVDVHGMRGIRLHPNYHGYALDHPQLARLLGAAAEKKLVVAVVALMEDERMMHPLLRVPIVDLGPLTNLVKQTAGLRLLLLNGALRAVRGDQLSELTAAGDVSIDIAMLEGVGGVEKLLQEIPVERVLFGSHAPSLYLESAMLKLQESPLAAFQLRALSTENARRLLPSA
jgi:predicted TIM-barrel fold metal-dependent hydrolase